MDRDPVPSVCTNNCLAALPRPKTEFEIEGHLELSVISTGSVFLIDDTFLSEYVQRHFGGTRDEKNMVDLGRCKVLIVPIKE